nr:M20/M25/M40 family metallo-hydrolase [uncultured Sphingomonas sp.]
MANRNRWRLLTVALALLCLFAIKNQLLSPPPAPAEISPDEFDHQRALVRLERILGDQSPHPVDTAANDAVRERLVAELRAIGLSARVQEASDCSDFPKSRTVSCSHVRNVVAVLPGPDRPALLLNAHYDSTPTGPGAADDGIGVATMLEVAALVKNETRDRPIIFLFNEGEEYGLNGAAAFVARDPLAKSVGRLINIEARGVSGPASMFETNTPNGNAIADYGAAARRPFANSLTADLAKLIPNSTDVVKFKKAGWETLNFAIVGNETRYHSPGDTIAALSPDSLAHMGGEVLSSTRRLARPAGTTVKGQAVYADIAGLAFPRLPQWLALTGVGLLTIGAVALGWHRRGFRALAAVTAVVIASITVTLLPSLIASMIRPGDFWRAYPTAAYLALYATLLAALLFGVARLGKHFDRRTLRLACWILIMIVGATLSIFLPGASIYFLFGPGLALTGIALEPRSRTVGHLLLIVGALVQLLMLAEVMAIFELLLIDGPLLAVAPLAAMASLPLLIEASDGSSSRGWMPLALIATFAWAAALFLPRGTAARPEAFTIDYVRDDVTGSTNWAVASKQAPLPQSMMRFGPWETKRLSYNGRLRWVADAPALNIPTASLRRTSNVVSGEGRVATLRLRTGGANAVLLRFDKSAPIRSMGLPGERHAIVGAGTDGPFVIRCSGRSCDGMNIEIEIGSPKPVSALLIAQDFSPPSEAHALIAAAPPHSQPQYAPNGAFRIRGYRL